MKINQLECADLTALHEIRKSASFGILGHKSNGHKLPPLSYSPASTVSQ